MKEEKETGSFSVSGWITPQWGPFEWKSLDDDACSTIDEGNWLVFKDGEWRPLTEEELRQMKESERR